MRESSRVLSVSARLLIDMAMVPVNSVPYYLTASHNDQIKIKAQTTKFKLESKFSSRQQNKRTTAFTFKCHSANDCYKNVPTRLPWSWFILCNLSQFSNHLIHLHNYGEEQYHLAVYFAPIFKYSLLILSNKTKICRRTFATKKLRRFSTLQHQKTPLYRFYSLKFSLFIIC